MIRTPGSSVRDQTSSSSPACFGHLLASTGVGRHHAILDILFFLMPGIHRIGLQAPMVKENISKLVACFKQTQSVEKNKDKKDHILVVS